MYRFDMAPLSLPCQYRSCPTALAFQEQAAPDGDCRGRGSPSRCAPSGQEQRRAGKHTAGDLKHCGLQRVVKVVKDDGGYPLVVKDGVIC